MGLELLLDRRLLVITGKGGAGKTTVAAALGVAATRSGRRTLVCELGAQQRLPAAFGRAAGVRGSSVRLAPGLWQLSLESGAALREWLRRQPGGAAAAALLMGSTAFQHFVAAGPGVKELVTVGKLGDLVASGRHDLIVVDAPASGHVLGLLTAPRTFAAIARGGRIHRDAAALWELLLDRRRTGYVGVALPEEMAVRELLDLDARLAAEIGHGLDAAVVDAVWPDRFTDAEAARLRALRERVGDRRSSAFLTAALSSHHRARSHRRRLEELRAGLDALVVVLPELFVDRLTPDDYARLAAVLVHTEAVPTRHAA